MKKLLAILCLFTFINTSTANAGNIEWLYPCHELEKVDLTPDTVKNSPFIFEAIAQELPKKEHENYDGKPKPSRQEIKSLTTYDTQLVKVTKRLKGEGIKDIVTIRKIKGDTQISFLPNKHYLLFTNKNENDIHTIKDCGPSMEIQDLPSDKIEELEDYIIDLTPSSQSFFYRVKTYITNFTSS